MDILGTVKSMMGCAGDIDNMTKFTETVDFYSSTGLSVPIIISKNNDETLSALVKRKDMYDFVRTIVIEDMGSCQYPLLGSKYVPNIDEHIGEGTTGHIYSMVTRRGQLAVKFQNHSKGTGRPFRPGDGSMDIPMNEFALEVSIQIVMSSIGLSPIVYNSWVSPYTTTWGEGDQDVMIMDRMEETLFDKTNRERDYTLGVIDLISNMHSNNIFHGDLHSGNIMIDKNNNPVIIDFGKSKPMPGDRDGKRWCMVHDFVLLYTSLLRRSELKPLLKRKILEIAPNRTILGTTFDLGD